jgi:hypothetical protein
MLSSPGNKTNLGLGNHQEIGSSSLYHGNIPCLYARSNRSSERSPPMASRPSSPADSGGGKTISLDKIDKDI